MTLMPYTSETRVKERTLEPSILKDNRLIRALDTKASVENRGVIVSVRRVEFRENSTEVYYTIDNTTGQTLTDSRSDFMRSFAVQVKKQFKAVQNISLIGPGVEVTLSYLLINPSLGKITFHIELGYLRTRVYAIDSLPSV